MWICFGVAPPQTFLLLVTHGGVGVSVVKQVVTIVIIVTSLSSMTCKTLVRHPKCPTFSLLKPQISKKIIGPGIGDLFWAGPYPHHPHHIGYWSNPPA